METQSLQLEELGCLFTKPFLFGGLVNKDPSRMSTNENLWTHILISACYKKYLCQNWRTLQSPLAGVRVPHFLAGAGRWPGGGEVSLLGQPWSPLSGASLVVCGRCSHRLVCV